MRRDELWNSVNGTYIKTVKPTGYDVLINGTDKYLNFNAVSGVSGYGFRDNGGIMEYKNSGGSWVPISSGGSFTLTDGSATTANGTSVDLGGTATGNIDIDMGTFNLRIISPLYSTGLFDIRPSSGLLILGDGQSTVNGTYALIDDTNRDITFTANTYKFNMNNAAGNSWYVNDSSAGMSPILIDATNRLMYLDNNDSYNIMVNGGNPAISAFETGSSIGEHTTMPMSIAYVVQDTDDVILLDTAGGLLPTAQLPDASLWENRRITIKPINGTVPLDVSAAAGNIDGSTNVSIAQNSALTFVAKSGNWYIIWSYGR